MADGLRTDKNKRAIVEEGAVPMFVQLLQSNDVKLQNEAVGALRNLSLDGTMEALGVCSGTCVGGGLPKIVFFFFCVAAKFLAIDSLF